MFIILEYINITLWTLEVFLLLSLLIFGNVEIEIFDLSIKKELED